MAIRSSPTIQVPVDIGKPFDRPDAGRPLRAVEFAAAAGLDTKKAKVEGLRSRLKLLAARGWVFYSRSGHYNPSLA